MASFVGNVFDENDNLTQVFYQAYHYNTRNWSDIRQTGTDGYYSRDHEDSDWDGNGVPLPTGDIIILVFWSNGLNKTGLKDRMSIHKVVSDGSNVYNINVQVIPKTSPTCTWNLSTEGTINNNISSTHSSSDIYQWTWDSKIFLHDDNYYGTGIFDSVGIVSHEYDWNNGLGFISDNYTQYSLIGDYQPEHKVTNNYGLSSICTKDIRIFYNTPIGSIVLSNNFPILYENIDITLNASDIDNRVTSISHYFDGTLIENNNDLLFSYNKDLISNQLYLVNSLIYWNDGFNDKELNITKNIVLKNTPPEVNIDINNINNTYDFISNAFDLEDELSIVQFKIYLCGTAIFEEAPTVCDWSLLDTTDVTIPDWNKSATFYKGGKFKVTVQAKDLDNEWSSISELIFDVSVTDAVTTVENTQGMHFFDWE